MKTLLPLTCILLLAFMGRARAEESAAPTVKIEMRDGSSIDVSRLSRRGALVMVPLANGSGEIGYPIAKIAQIDFPEPVQLDEAQTLLSEGKATEALARIEPIVAFHAPLYDIAGNFWRPAAFLKMKALLALKRYVESDGLLKQIAAAAGNDPAITARVEVEKAASLTRNGKDEQALPIYDQIIEKSTDPETLALAWLNKGQSLLAMKQYDPALLAFLHLPVFYSDQTPLLPAALLGGAKAFKGLEIKDQARGLLQELLDEYPRTPEAGLAKNELKKL